tara:strand:- start:6 stop:491 length:486 start_codon:yes stop_codon:yes gene_type:complete
MSSPVATSTVSASKRVTAVLPKAAKTNINTFIRQCAKNGSLDASTVLALTALMDDREFALAFKNDLAEVMEKQKEIRSANKAIRAEKKAAKENSSAASSPPDSKPASPKADSSWPSVSPTSKVEEASPKEETPKEEKPKKEKKERKKKAKKPATPVDSDEE